MTTLSQIRPGIKNKTLELAGITHVSGEEAKSLIGFTAEGLAIPYLTLGGRPLEVQGRHFHRVRLSNAKGSAKYLSPRGSGAQLYIPPSHRAQPVMYITEGEFKALSLCEAGVFAVGIGGITSSMTEGKLIPALKTIIEKKAVEEIRFLGDADTPLICDFSNEAIKLRGALPDHVRLVLPTVPFDGPKGIDDSRDSHAGDFLTWLENLPCIEVKKGMTAGGLALKRITPILPMLDYDDAEGRLLKFAARLDPASLDRFASLIKSTYGVGATAFKKAAKQHGAVSPDAPEETPDVFFDGTKYFRSNGDGFEAICREDCNLELRTRGFSPYMPDGATVSPLERVLHRIQTDHRVSYAGAICGRPAGLHRENGITVLSTRGPRIVGGSDGDHSPLTDFLCDLFGREAGDPLWQSQFITFWGWLKHFRKALEKHDHHMPGQALALVGPPDCGKSVLQSIITEATTGRSASAGLWLFGKTDFNKELWGAEHLTLDDDNLPPDIRESSEVRDRLKKLAITNLFPLHAKHRDAENFRPIWRVSISANSDDESIHVLPLPDESFGDKIIYFLCHPPRQPFHDGSDQARTDWYNGLMAAIPPFVAGLEEDIDEDFRASRFYVKEFHHPEVLRAIYSSAPEADLGEILDRFLSDEAADIEGSASEILERLNANIGERQVRSVTKSARHLGWQLSRLARLPTWKDRINRRSVRVGGRIKNDSVNFWRISPLRTNAD